METPTGTNLQLGLRLPTADVDVASSASSSGELFMPLHPSSFLVEEVELGKNAVRMSTKEDYPDIPDVTGTFEILEDTIGSPRRSPRISEKQQSLEIKHKEETSPRAKAQELVKAKPKARAKPRGGGRKPETERMAQLVELLRSKNKALCQKKWALENEITVLKAKIMTDSEEVASAEDMEQQLHHARRYIRALKTQVRALGGYAMRSTFELDSDSEASKSDDGDLPASFPRGAAEPGEFSLSAMRQRKRTRAKK